MRLATEREILIWRLAEAGVIYTEIAARAQCGKGSIAGILYRIRHGEITIPAKPVIVGGCRWVNGDPRRVGWSWCDAPVLGNGAWCADHRSRVYQRRLAPLSA